jgi:hypothetical protein
MGGAGGMMPPPGGMGGMMGGMMGAHPCEQQSDCEGNCPPNVQSCTCAQTPMGMACIPNCQQDSDCPHPPDRTLVCDPQQHVCVPQRQM